MAENSDPTLKAVLIFVDQVCGILPNITPDLLEKLLEYLKSAGVHSEADIGKVDEHQVAAILGHEDAKKLMDYFKKPEPVKVELPSSSTPNSALPVAPQQPTATGFSQGGGRENAVNVSLPVALQQPMTVGSSNGNGRDNTMDILQMVMMMQKMESEKNREMLMAMQQSQERTLNAVTSAMAEMTTMHKGTLDKMSEQMTEQSKMHQETIRAMNEQMQTTAKMHGETLQAVQHGMRETQRMNAETLAQVTKSMTATLEAQERSMHEYRMELAQQRHDSCVIL